MTQRERSNSIAIHFFHLMHNFEPFKPRKATITRRGGALGHVSFQQDEGSNEESQSLEHLRSHLVVGMGGRAAEAIFFGEEKVHTGASSDMQMAYRIAKNIGIFFLLLSNMKLILFN